MRARMRARRQLRLRISQLMRDDKLGRIDKDVCRKQVTECIVALRQLGEEVGGSAEGGSMHSSQPCGRTADRGREGVPEN